MTPFTSENIKAFETENFEGDIDLIMGSIIDRVITNGMFAPTNDDIKNIQEFANTKHKDNGAIYNASIELQHGDFLGTFAYVYLIEFFKEVNNEVMISTRSLLWNRMFSSITHEGRSFIMKDIGTFNHMLNYGDYEEIIYSHYNIEALKSFAFLTDHEQTRFEHAMIVSIIDKIESGNNKEETTNLLKSQLNSKTLYIGTDNVIEGTPFATVETGNDICSITVGYMLDGIAQEVHKLDRVRLEEVEILANMLSDCGVPKDGIVDCNDVSNIVLQLLEMDEDYEVLEFLTSRDPSLELSENTQYQVTKMPQDVDLTLIGKNDNEGKLAMRETYVYDVKNNETSILFSVGKPEGRRVVLNCMIDGDAVQLSTGVVDFNDNESTTTISPLELTPEEIKTTVSLELDLTKMGVNGNNGIINLNDFTSMIEKAQGGSYDLHHTNFVIENDEVVARNAKKIYVYNVNDNETSILFSVGKPEGRRVVLTCWSNGDVMFLSTDVVDFEEDIVINPAEVTSEEVKTIISLELDLVEMGTNVTNGTIDLKGFASLIEEAQGDSYDLYHTPFIVEDRVLVARNVVLT